MAKLGKEATTTRRVLESLFRYFDNGEFWSMEQGLAFPVLKDMQFLMDSSGQNTHVLLSMLIKHLDHKNVLKKPNMQLDIVLVTTSLAQLAKVENTVAIIGAVNDLMRHLRRSIHCLLDDANLGFEVKKWNASLREAVDKCLTEVSHKVGDAGPVLEVMAVMLENISTITVIARTTVSAVYRMAQIIAPIPNLLYRNKTFPEALFHQLLPIMVHPDHETRVGAHRIFAVVLLPSSVAPRPTTVTTDLKKSSELMRTLSRTVSVFSASAALFEKLKKDKPSVRNAAGQEINKNVDAEGEKTSQGMVGRLKSSYSRAYNSSSVLPSVAEDDTSNAVDKETEAGVRLSSRQISLLLSSIWSQSISPANNPENYEAISHTYSLVVLFSSYKNSSNEALIRSFQLAFSLRSVALNEGGPLPPSRRRSLFTLATSMILFLSNAFNIVPLVSCTKSFLTQKLVDPYLRLVEDRKLQAVNTSVNHPTIVFGSKEDDVAAQRSLSQIDITGEQSKESCTAEIIKSLSNSSESELATIREQLLKEFLPEDVCPMGAQLLNEITRKSGQVIPKDDSHTEAASSSITDDACLDSFEAQTKPNMQLVIHNPKQLLSINQLLDSVLETGNQVGRLSVSAPDVSYKEIARLCESLQMGKQMKMSHVMNTQMWQEDPVNSSELNNDDAGIKASNGNPFLDDDFSANSQLQLVPAIKLLCAAECQHDPNTFRLPAASPYDNFLKAAGC